MTIDPLGAEWTDVRTMLDVHVLGAFVCAWGGWRSEQWPKRSPLGWVSPSRS